MERQPVWMIKTQGALALFAAVLGVLIMLAAPASIRSFADGVTATPHMASSASETRVVRSPFATSAMESGQSFHSIAQTSPQSSLSGGAFGMLLLVLLSLAMLIGAFLFRGPEAEGRSDR